LKKNSPFLLLVLVLLSLAGYLFIFSLLDPSKQRLIFGKPAGRPFSKKETALKLEEMEKFWETLANRHISESGEVSYQAFLKRKNQLDQLFDQYISRFSLDLFNQGQKKSFLINVYNILTIRAMLNFYPLKSVLDQVDRTRIGFHFWKDTYAKIGNEILSLEEIEHEHLRKMSDPRIHFAIVCGAKSCPKLLNSSYRSQEIEQQLQQQANDFFSRENHFKIDHELETVLLSKLLKWFREDFGNTNQEILARIGTYLTPNEKEKLQTPLTNYEIHGYLNYDWALNDWKESKLSQGTD